MPIADRHVLFVEDVIDTGLTLNYFLRTLAHAPSGQPASVRLFDRPYRRFVDIPVAYQGFELPDRFVVGYGLEHRSLSQPALCGRAQARGARTIE